MSTVVVGVIFELIKDVVVKLVLLVGKVVAVPVKEFVMFVLLVVDEVMAIEVEIEEVVAGEVVDSGPDGQVQLPLDHCTCSVQTHTPA